jgi:hypothetical protein
VALIFGVTSALPYIWPNNPIISLLAAAFFFVPVVVPMGGQIYRNRRVSAPTRRQQTRWIILSIATFILAQLVSVISTLIVPALGQSGSLYQIVA